jgi:hypothetical protein
MTRALINPHSRNGHAASCGLALEAPSIETQHGAKLPGRRAVQRRGNRSSAMKRFRSPMAEIAIVTSTVVEPRRATSFRSRNRFCAMP